MLKADIGIVTELLHPIIQEVWESEIVPEEFTDALIIKLAKKGDLTVCSNWRGITLLNTISKILSIIIHERISKVLEPVIRKLVLDPTDHASITSTPFESSWNSQWNSTRHCTCFSWISNRRLIVWIEMSSGGFCRATASLQKS